LTSVYSRLQMVQNTFPLPSYLTAMLKLSAPNHIHVKKYLEAPEHRHTLTASTQGTFQNNGKNVL
jgi:hypothetical protein